MALGYGRTGTNNFACAKFIVDANGLASGATHTTIAAALASAVSGETIFIKPGTYTEDLTLKAGVNLIAFVGDADTPNVTIVGKATATFAGTASISGIRLQTNSDFFLVVSGTEATVLKFYQCHLNCTDTTGFSYTTSSSDADILFYNCRGDLGTTGIGYFASSSAGALVYERCILENSGASTTASTLSAGILSLKYTRCIFAITTSSTAVIQADYSSVAPAAAGLNITSLTHGGTGSNCDINYCTFFSGSASAVSIGTGATLNLRNSTISSSNTNAITGVGALTYANISFINSSNTMNTTTQTSGVTRSGIWLSSHQPAFLVGIATTIDNQTGDNTAYTIAWTSEIYDQNADFSSTTFTAPYTGKYQFSTIIAWQGLTSSHTGALTRIGTSNRDYNVDTNPWNLRNVASTTGISCDSSILADMDAADTSSILVVVYNGTKVADLNSNCHFSGELIC